MYEYMNSVGWKYTVDEYMHSNGVVDTQMSTSKAKTKSIMSIHMQAITGYWLTVPN